ncbi:hypothetical protein B9Z65_8708 [Elsinoe australis]|uniref:Zn(2)-C6 fungal-type domain-containing protein n=1 Tax=Elsinoe australis TaxID=40998 RepID=A0A2P7YEI7_9PEZI|nr:hypothetical protein B9Z65_8708 [Elsinoe australis]
MASPENDESPPTAGFGRKNKLGYTRISVACAHCRRRKIRCVRAEEDPENRCANCIKLKKECIFTSVDTATGGEGRAQSKTGLNSQTSSVMSRSPSGVSPDHRDGVEHPSQSHVGMYSDSPGMMPMGTRAPGMMMPSNMVQPEHMGIQRAGHPDWHTHPVDMDGSGYGSSHGPMQWPPHSDSMRFSQATQPMGYPYIDHSRGDATRQPAWTSAEQTTASTYHAPLAAVSGFPQQHAQGVFQPGYGQQSGPIVSQTVVPSQQYYTQRSGHAPHAGETGYGWAMYPQESALPGSPRHDSMATNWSRGPSYSGNSYPVGYDPRKQQLRHSSSTAEPPG